MAQPTTGHSSALQPPTALRDVHVRFDRDPLIRIRVYLEHHLGQDRPL